MAALLDGMELDLFTPLDGGPLGAVELAARLGPPLYGPVVAGLLSFFDGGRAYTEGEYRAWLAEAGFGDFRHGEVVGGSGLLRARKR